MSDKSDTIEITNDVPQLAPSKSTRIECIDEPNIQCLKGEIKNLCGQDRYIGLIDSFYYREFLRNLPTDKMPRIAFLEEPEL